MFTGIVQGYFPVTHVERRPGLIHYAVALPEAYLTELRTGASIAIDGVCQTVVAIRGKEVYFDAIDVTLNCTTLDTLEMGRLVNVERSARLGDEVGGHLLSGHVYGVATIESIALEENNRTLTIRGQPAYMKYLLKKGYIALDGVSLTVVDVSENSFRVSLIPETLRLTTFGKKQKGDRVNIEIDTQIQAIVDTVERLLKKLNLQL